MTANQLIILFDAVRGFDQDRHMGGFKEEAEALEKLGLVIVDEKKGRMSVKPTSFGTEVAKQLATASFKLLIPKEGQIARLEAILSRMDRAHKDETEKLRDQIKRLMEAK